MGHKKQLELLGKSIESGKLAHAYIFAGPEGVGKKTIALKLAQELLKGERFSHPDLLFIDGQDSIKIEQVRDLIYKLSLKPYSANFKIAIIDNAENLTLEASQALLKVMEEPKPNTIIILITANPNRLLKTIASRAQKINFGPLSKEEAEALPAKLSVEQKEQLKETLRQFTQGGLVEKLRLASELAELETIEIKQALDFWLKYLEQDLIAHPTQLIAKRISLVSQSRNFLDQNLNSKLLLTNLMLNS